MTDQPRRPRILAAVTIMLVSAGLTFLILYLTGPVFFLPAAAVMTLTNHPQIAILTPFVILPLLAVVFWRYPWWVRWIFLGFLLHNIALLAVVELRIPGPGLFS